MVSKEKMEGIGPEVRSRVGATLSVELSADSGSLHSLREKFLRSSLSFRDQHGRYRSSEIKLRSIVGSDRPRCRATLPVPARFPRSAAHEANGLHDFIA